jgi:ADP-heptose:LPS heptosyltransferase
MLFGPRRSHGVDLDIVSTAPDGVKRDMRIKDTARNSRTSKLLSAFNGTLPRRVGILRGLQLGDMLCAVPALRALRTALPESEQILIGLPWARVLVDRYPMYLDGFREFPGWPGLPECVPQWNQIPTFVSLMQRERFDLVVQLHGSGEITNSVAALFRGRRTTGFYTPGKYRPDADLFAPYPDEGLEIHRLLRLVEFLELPTQGDRLEFPMHTADGEELRAVLGKNRLEPGRYVCVHPGASVPERRWPAEQFAVVVRALAARGFQVVLTGTAPEAGVTSEVARTAQISCVDLSGRTSLGAVAALLSKARVLVCNDTGVSHLAAALRTPSVVITTGDNAARWAPADASIHRIVGGHVCADTQAVLEQAQNLLDDHAASATVSSMHEEKIPWGSNDACNREAASNCCVGSKE